MGLVLFNVITNGLDGAIECILGEFTDNTRLGGGSAEGRKAVQRDLDMLD